MEFSIKQRLKHLALKAAEKRKKERKKNCQRRLAGSANSNTDHYAPQANFHVSNSTNTGHYTQGVQTSKISWDKAASDARQMFTPTKNLAQVKSMLACPSQKVGHHERGTDGGGVEGGVVN